MPKRSHNAKFHMVLLARNGLPVHGLAFDTMIAAYLLESGQRALALRDLAWAKVQVEIPSVQSLLGVGRKATHVSAGFRDDRFSRPAFHTGYRHQPPTHAVIADDQK